MTDETKAVTQTASASLAQLASEVLAPGERLGLWDLPRITVPAGGGLIWQLPDGTGAQRIEAVIIHRQLTRAYWPAAFSGGPEPPACSSHDAVTGIGDPGGECARCPMAQWGSDGDRGQACKLITWLFLLRDGEPVPTLMVLPPSAATPVRQYVVQLLTRGLPYWAVRTAIGLERRQSASGIAYSAPRFEVVGQLDEEEARAAAEARAAILPLLGAVDLRRGDIEGR